MAPILELIKKNAVPVNVMRSAAKGALPLTADETLEVLVYLTKNPVFGQDARMTLAKWDAQSAMEVLAKDTAPAEVLLYFWQEANRRPGLMPTMIENPAIPDTLLMELGSTAPREIVTMLLNSQRVRQAPAVVEALLTNEYLTPAEAAELKPAVTIAEAAPLDDDDAEISPEVQAAHEDFEKEHAVEIAAAEGKPFELAPEDAAPAEVAPSASQPLIPTPTQGPVSPIANAAPGPAPTMAGEFDTAEQKRMTVLQKVSRLNVGQRIKLGFIGNKEERAILIRDTARLVQNAVLQSPKLTDAEVESFAGAKNLTENVFREINRHRRYLKLYPVVRNLVNNPKCPLDISLTLIKSLMVQDLKSLRHSKGVPDTIRKVAAKLYQEKATRGGSKKE